MVRPKRAGVYQGEDTGTCSIAHHKGPNRMMGMRTMRTNQDADGNGHIDAKGDRNGPTREVVGRNRQYNIYVIF